jgi:hypothetical protein
MVFFKSVVIRRLKLAFAGILLLAAFSSFAQKPDDPVDPQATRETINLYRHLKTLAGKGFLFGHQNDLAYGFNWKYIPGRSDIKDVTGDYPAQARNKIPALTEFGYNGLAKCRV